MTNIFEVAEYSFIDLSVMILFQWIGRSDDSLFFQRFFKSSIVFCYYFWFLSFCGWRENEIYRYPCLMLNLLIFHHYSDTSQINTIVFHFFHVFWSICVFYLDWAVDDFINGWQKLRVDFARSDVGNSWTRTVWGF